MKTYVHYDNIPSEFWEWEMFQTQVAEKIKTHFMFSNIFFENPTVYEICGKML
jgi:hypothetical protein